jgi:hypothetical protein
MMRDPSEQDTAPSGRDDEPQHDPDPEGTPDGSDTGHHQADES